MVAKKEWESPLWEIYGAKLWNVANESKSFVALTTLFLIFLLNLPRFAFLEAGFWKQLFLITPFCFSLWHFDYPLKLRISLWGVLAVTILYFSIYDEVTNLLFPLGLILLLYFSFTLGVWGFIYYHFLTKEPWSTTKNFWKPVLTNDDSTSGNFWQCFPQIFAPIVLFLSLKEEVPNVEVYLVEAASFLLIIISFFVHVQWHKKMGTRQHPKASTLVKAKASKMVVIVIDGGRRDRIRNPAIPTPFMDNLAKKGVEYSHVWTMYPARTSVCFSSMLTGKLPQVHGVKSNLVTRPVRGETIFDKLERKGKRGALVGIAHFDDIAHKNWNVRSVCSFLKNEVADKVIFDVTKQVIEDENPDLMVTQLIAVDQTGHMRGSLGTDYAEAVTRVDKDIEDFVGWLNRHNFFADGILLIMSDHGQGRGIGGHGYWGEGEILVPLIIYGKGVPKGELKHEKRSIMDLAPTIEEVLL